MMIDDRRLIDRAKEGDQDAFARLMGRNEKMVYSVALQKVGNHHDAEEIAQIAFFKAWRSLPNFRGDSTFSTWLYRLTINACTDFFRRQQRRQESVSLDDPDLPPYSADPSYEPEERFRRSEAQAMLMDAIDQLSGNARTILLMREFDGLTYDEIAAALDISVGTVRSRLARARAGLAKILRGEGNLSEDSASNMIETQQEGGDAP